MRVPAEVLEKVIPMFLEDGWQVVRIIHWNHPYGEVTPIVERAWHR